MKTPVIITANDYHEFAHIKDVLRQFKETVFYKELEFYYTYAAVFWRVGEWEEAKQLWNEWKKGFDDAALPTEK